MARGGRRPGAGRKRGAVTQRSAAAANRLAKSGVLPLEILVTSMRRAWAEGDSETAWRLAQEAAPYFHARISAKDAPVPIAGLAERSLSQQGQAVIAAMGRGELSPGQVAAVLSSLASQAKLVEADELEQRIRTLEERLAGSGGSR